MPPGVLFSSGSSGLTGPPRSQMESGEWARLADDWEKRLARAEKAVAVEDRRAARKAAKVPREAAKAEAKEERAKAKAERAKVKAEKAKAKEEKAKARAEKAQEVLVRGHRNWVGAVPTRLLCSIRHKEQRKGNNTPAFHHTSPTFTTSHLLTGSIFTLRGQSPWNLPFFRTLVSGGLPLQGFLDLIKALPLLRGCPAHCRDFSQPTSWLLDRIQTPIVPVAGRAEDKQGASKYPADTRRPCLPRRFRKGGRDAEPPGTHWKISKPATYLDRRARSLRVFNACAASLSFQKRR